MMGQIAAYSGMSVSKEELKDTKDLFGAAFDLTDNMYRTCLLDENATNSTQILAPSSSLKSRAFIFAVRPR